MAPTKPLVAQQIEACFNIMGIPQSDTAEMTGEGHTKSFLLSVAKLVETLRSKLGFCTFY